MSSYVPPFRPGVSPVAKDVRAPIKWTDPSAIVREPRGDSPKSPVANLRGGQVRQGPRNPESRVVDPKESVNQAKAAYGAWCVEDQVRSLPPNNPVRKEFERQQVAERKAFEEKYGVPSSPVIVAVSKSKK